MKDADCWAFFTITKYFDRILCNKRIDKQISTGSTHIVSYIQIISLSLIINAENLVSFDIAFLLLFPFIFEIREEILNKQGKNRLLETES